MEGDSQAEAWILTESGEDIQQIEFPMVSDLSDVKGIKKSERAELEGHESEYNGFFLMFKIGDFKLDPGTYQIQIRVTDGAGGILLTDEQEFEVMGSSSELVIEEGNRWGSVQADYAHVFHMATDVESMHVGKKQNIKGFVLMRDGDKAKYLTILLIPPNDADNPIEVYRSQKVSLNKGDLRNYPEAERYLADLPAGGTFNVDANINKKTFKNYGLSPGKYTLRATLGIDSEGAVQEYILMKQIEVTADE